jgi:hypothetical protein
MSVNIYKPNKNNTGFAFSFSKGKENRTGEPILYVKALAQHSWDEKRKLGSFSENKNIPEKNINLKFNEFECGEIISCFKNRYNYDSFHKFESNKTSIKFAPWDKKVKITKINPETKKFEETSQLVPAFGLSITRNGNQNFKISLEPGEVECLLIYIKSILNDIYEYRYKKISAYIKENSSDIEKDTPPF